MAYHYVIGLNNVEYIPHALADSDAKVVWEKHSSGLVYKKSLDGKFVLNRSNNEALYDAIMAMTYCYNGSIAVKDHDDYNVVKSIFGKRDIEYNEDKCQLVIKPRFYEPSYSCIAGKGDEEINIIQGVKSTYGASFVKYRTFEFKECTDADACVYPNNIEVYPFPEVKAICGEITDQSDYNLITGWTFHSQVNSWVQPPTECGGLFEEGYYEVSIYTLWYREVSFVPIIDDSGYTANFPSVGTGYDWNYTGEVTIDGKEYYKYHRAVIDSSPSVTTNTQFRTVWINGDAGFTPRTVSRCRKLIDVLNFFADECGCTLQSEFFTNTVNPVSLKDLSNLMIAQKSDCIFSGSPPAEPVDPATIGMLTFNKLMRYLKAMFQVEYTIDNYVLTIEHISYFRNNGSYVPNNDVGIDLQSVYPICLKGSNAYSFDNTIPLREQFKFMEAWNIDFRGKDIEYTNCITEGSTESYGADEFTTDTDTDAIDTEASKDGFMMFHCESQPYITINSKNIYHVISETGMITEMLFSNAHLSWANLHHYYWQHNRPLPLGRMNGKVTNFTLTPRKLKQQIDIQFPFCVENFDPNKLIKTDMGNGEVNKAEYSFKTGNIKVQLIYE